MSAETVEGYMGWESGPNRRGTLQIIYACISTIILCTWTVLHCNVPDQGNSSFKNFLHKMKLMIIAILLPEFFLAQGLEELKTAVEDLFATDLKVKEVRSLQPDYRWKVEISRLCQILSRIFAISRPRPSTTINNIEEGTSTEEQQICSRHATSEVENSLPSEHSAEITDSKEEIPSSDYTWTLGHSYLANMGGLRRRLGEDHKRPFAIVTAGQLSKCCIGTTHDPLPELHLAKEDINDKSKTDPISLTITILQILMLVLSLIVRAYYRMPMTQLEIATAAFAIIAVATYVVNWYKPKDVARPIAIKHLQDQECSAEPVIFSLIYCLMNPTEMGTKESMLMGHIPADEFRSLDSISLLIAISSFVFGGLHCLAWDNYFPSNVEALLWKIASISSAVLPIFPLAMRPIAKAVLNRQSRLAVQDILDLYKDVQNISNEWFTAAVDSRLYLDFLNEFDITDPSQAKFSWVHLVTVVHVLQQLKLSYTDVSLQCNSGQNNSQIAEFFASVR